MVMRRAYWLISFLRPTWCSLVMMTVAASAEAGDDELADGAG